MYNAMNISPRPYASQGYRTEQESEEQTQDALSQDNRQQQGGRGQNQQQGNNEPKTIARGRAPMTATGKKPFPGQPMSARRGRPVQMGGSRPQAQPQPQRPMQQPIQNPTPAPRVMGNQSVPLSAPRAPQQPMQAPMSAQNNIQMAPRQPMQQPVQQPMQPKQAMYDDDPELEKQINDMSKNNRVNIAQIIKDFRGTYAAIGTPQCLVDEVEEYLKQVIKHTKGDAPSINFVQTNLQNAAVIIDKYISETLNKDSKVVQNWLDALFLQRINYHYNDGEVNENFLVKFPQGGNAPQQPDSVVSKDEIPPAPIEQKPMQKAAPQEIPDYEPIPEYNPAPQPPVNQTVPIEQVRAPQPMSVHSPQARRQAERVIRKAPRPVREQAPVQMRPVIQPRKKPEIKIIPEDTELKALFIQAKKQAFSNNPAKAMNIFQKALVRAEAINDCDAQSKICYEMGRIYDDNNYLVQALSNYNKSLQDTTDTDIKTKAHYSMAKIYDDVNQVHSAIDHYMTSVSYAGREDNLSSQSKSLTNIANIYTDKYDQNAFVFYDEANVLIEQTDDAQMKGYVSSNTAGALNTFNQPAKALKCYANAVKNYSDAEENGDVAENYYAAGELMYDLKNPTKAKILLRKALAHTKPYKDAELINKINDLLEEIG